MEERTRTPTLVSQASKESMASVASKASDAITPKKLEEGDMQPEDEMKELGYHYGQPKPTEIVVNWEGPDDPNNPQNWSPRQKWGALIIVSAYTFLSPVASAMVAPAASAVARDFHVTNDVVTAMLVSIFILAYAFGPLILGPLSEMYGRAPVLQGANLFFLIFNTACGFAQNTHQFLAFRFLAGLGGSAPLSIGGGVIGDTFTPEERGRAVSVYSLAPVLGPALGPVAGGFIAEKTTWRWVFWSSSIVGLAVQAVGLFTLKETFHPVLLERKAKRIRKEMGMSPKDNTIVHTKFDNADRHWKQIFSRSLIRPFALFYSEPIIQLLGLYMAFIYGLVYLVLVIIPSIFEGTYKETVGIAGLNYIALGLGLLLGAQANARILDYVYKKYKAKNNGVGKPEFRLPSLFLGSVILPIGLFIAGWSAQQRFSWVLTDFGIFLVGAGLMPVFQGVQNYVIDAFTLYAASALAAVAFLRSLAGFGFPLFAAPMYKALGFGKGNTILGACAIGIGWPASICFWIYGERIRKRSRYARKT